MSAGALAQSVRFPPSQVVDFVIVGSGAAGGIMAKELSTAGFSVVVLEQGPRLTEADFTHDEFGVFMQGRHRNFPSTQPQMFRADPSGTPQLGLPLIYGRHVGGSNAHFTANFWRLRPNDFNEASRLGGVAGTTLVDWPSSSPITPRPNGSWVYQASRVRSIRRDRSPIRCRRCR
jgi:choline dehydrogenase-like flavoprotein